VAVELSISRIYCTMYVHRSQSLWSTLYLFCSVSSIIVDPPTVGCITNKFFFTRHHLHAREPPSAVFVPSSRRPRHVQVGRRSPAVYEERRDNARWSHNAAFAPLRLAPLFAPRPCSVCCTLQHLLPLPVARRLSRSLPQSKCPTHYTRYKSRA